MNRINTNREEKTILSPEETQKSIETHRQAAAHLEEAAKHHHEAASYHEIGDHDEAIIRMIKAHGFAKLATEVQNDNLMFMSKVLFK